MTNVLFVCTGNICRSPMAEGLMRHAAQSEDGLRVASAGVGAADGHPPSLHAVQALREVGIDITGQRSRTLTPDLVDQAHFIFGMTHGHVETINLLYPAAQEKTFLLREFDESVAEHEKDVSDPVGGPFEVYQKCRDEIVCGINSVIKFIARTKSLPQLQLKKQVGTIALGADHAGFALKEQVKQYLERGTAEIRDLGTCSQESSDYPDQAAPVAELVSSREAEFGIIVCGTGLGVCIAANKFSGVRAVAVRDVESAAIARKHNDANVLCLGGRNTSPEQAIATLDTFLTTSFDGGRHERRVEKVAMLEGRGNPQLLRTDPAISKIIRDERNRQQTNIELIASENFTSRAIMEAQGSVLTNESAEGYPGRRWYGGCECVDEAEILAIVRAKQLFGAEHANVQPHSGSGANMAVYFSVLKPGDKILTMDLNHGGHLTHGNKANFSGKFFEVVHYGVRKDDELIDYDELANLAEQHRPKMLTVGASAYPRIIDFKRMGEIARSVDALLLADIAHIAGLVCAGIHPSPVGHADFVTTTTHKTLRGPRGGLILCGNEYAKAIDSQTFPGIQGGPLMHVIAAKAVCFHEALQPAFKSYQAMVVANAQALAGGLQRNGYRLVSGGTDNHLMLIDVGARDLTGKKCEAALDQARITVNKNTIPFETRSPFQASGIRLGTPAVTTRGMTEADMAAIADMISEVLAEVNNLDAIDNVRKRVKELTARFPLPY